VTAPFSLPKSGRRQPRRRVKVLGREYAETVYQPSYALGIACADEAEQRATFARLSKMLPNREIKVLVI